MSDKLKNYEILETIATGGMATIYKGVQISLNREVVIKKLHPHLAEDANFVERFKREAAILAKLQHKNIVQIIDFFEENNEQFIVLEYIKGKTLKELINSKERIPYSVSMYIMREVLHGLQYIHNNNILHRDMKPDNIMISDDGGVKITDFGLAYRHENVRITNPGTYVGTPAYFPPEQLTGKPLTKASDIFSLGITFAEMLTGKNPFEGKKQFETINNILYHKSVNISFTGKTPQSAVSLLHSMLEKDADKRIQNCNDILNVLSRIEISITREDFLEYISDKAKMEDEFTFVIQVRTRSDTGKVIVLLLLLVVFFGVSLFELYTYFTEERIIIRTEKEKTYTLYIDSRPRGVEIAINDSIRVRTPQNIDISRGTYHLSVVSDSFEIYDTSFMVTSNDTLMINAVKKTYQHYYGSLSVKASPWADLYIDNILIDRTPIQNDITLEEGRYFIMLKHPNRKVYSDTVEIVRDSVYSLNVELEKAYGFLKVIVRPWGTVYVDDSLIGTTPLADSVTLLTGPHSIRVQNPGFASINEEIDIREKEVLRKVYSFQ